jgi:hypothetical protein
MPVNLQVLSPPDPAKTEPLNALLPSEANASALTLNACEET